MTLKFRHMPKMLSIKEADRLRARSDPYKLVRSLFEKNDYSKIAMILSKKKNPRHVAAVPTLLIHEERDYERLYGEMRKRGVLNEFLYCIRIARSLANEFHDHFSSELETMVSTKCIASSLGDYSYAEFKHFYEVYRRYGFRTTSA